MNTADQTPLYFVLGATGGVGRALSHRLSRDGARVVVAGRSLDALEELADEVAGVPLRVDGRDFDQVSAAFDEVGRLPGRFAGAANCAGSILLKPAHLTTAQELEDTLATNLGTAFAMVRAAGRVLRRGGGSVVLVSSAAAAIGLANHEAIAASKAAIEGLTRSAAATYAGSGLRINAVAPGLVDSKMSQRIVGNAKALEASLALHPLGRVGKPEEIADLMAWLLSPAADWVSGQVWGIDGGLGHLKTR